MIKNRRKFKRNKSISKSLKLGLTLGHTDYTHIAKLSKMEQLPDGTFVEVEFASNKVLIGGMRELMGLIYNVKPNYTVERFENDLYETAEENLVDQIVPDYSNRRVPFVQGFNVSFDGTQGDGITSYPRHKIGYDFATMIPFRTIPLSENDFSVYKEMYLHHRVIRHDGRDYVEYYTKKINITVNGEFSDGTLIPNNPGSTVTTDLDSKCIAEFPINITDKELTEHFRLKMESGAEGTHYNATMLMMGDEASIELGGVSYPTMANSIVYARSNHVTIAHGVDAFIQVKYKMMHI